MMEDTYTVDVRGKIVEFPSSVPIEEAAKIIARDLPPTGEEVAEMMKDRDYELTREHAKTYIDYMKSGDRETDWIDMAGTALGHLGNLFGKGVKSVVTDPLKTAPSVAEGVAQGTVGMYEMFAQSPNPDSLGFKIKNSLFGDGSFESQYKQIKEARDFGFKMQDAIEGNKTFIVPEEYLNNDTVQLFAATTDISTLIPGSQLLKLGKLAKIAEVGNKINSVAQGAVGKTLKGSGRVMRSGAGLVDKGLSKVLPAAETMTDARAGIAGIGAGAALPGPVGAALTAYGTAVSGSKGADAIGDILYQTGKGIEGMPSRIGALEAIANNPSSSTTARLLASSMHFAGGDTLIDFGIKASGGAAQGAVLGGAMGYYYDQEQGLAGGLATGGALGASSAGLVRGVEYLTGRAGREKAMADGMRYLSRISEDASGLANKGAEVMSKSGQLDKGEALAMFSDIHDLANRMGYDLRYVDNDGPLGSFNQAAGVAELNVGAIDRTTAPHEIAHALMTTDLGDALRSDLSSNFFGDYAPDGTKIRDGIYSREDMQDFATKYEIMLAKNPEAQARWSRDKRLAFDETITADSPDYAEAALARNRIAEEFAAYAFGEGVFEKSIFGNRRRYTDQLLQGKRSTAVGLVAKLTRAAFRRSARNKLKFELDMSDEGRLKSSIQADFSKAGPYNRAVKDIYRQLKRLTNEKDLAITGDESLASFRTKGLSQEEMQARHKAGFGDWLVDGATGKVIRYKTNDDVAAVENARERKMQQVAESLGIDLSSRAFENENGEATINLKELVDAIGTDKADQFLGALKENYNTSNKQALDMLLDSVDGKSKPVFKVLYYKAYTRSKKGQAAPTTARAYEYELVPYEVLINKKDGVYYRAVNMDTVRSYVVEALKLPEYSSLYADVGNRKEAVMKDIRAYLENLTSDNPVPTSELLIDGKPVGETKRNFLHEAVGVRPTKDQRFVNVPRSRTISKRLRDRPSTTSFRLERTIRVSPTGEVLNFTEQAYKRAQENFMPMAEIRFMPAENQPENAPVQGRLTEQQQANIDELVSHYKKVSPERVKKLSSEAIDSLSSRLINEGISVTEAKEAARQYHKKVLKHSRESYQVMSGFGDSDLSRMAGTGRPALPTRKGVNPNWLTSAFEAIEGDKELALLKTQQVAKGVNKKQLQEIAEGKVIDASKASNVRSATLEEGMEFLRREALADKKAFGSSLREDINAVPRVYASVTEGQKFGAAGNFNVFFRWKKEAPMVITSHHHYGVGNGITDIHRSADVGDKNARSFGDPTDETYSTLPSGKKILDTHLLVSGKYAPQIRAHQLTVSVPQSEIIKLRKSLKRGEKLSDGINQLALRQLVGFQSQGKAASFRSSDGIPVRVAIQRNRTEAYVLNPDLKNVAEVVIASNKPDEIKRFKQNLKRAFENNGSPMPKVKVVSKDSGPSGNKGRKKITDEWEKATGEVVYMPSDADYMKAVEGGDMKAAQRMVDQAAKAAGYDPKTLYHNTNATIEELSKGFSLPAFFTPDVALFTKKGKNKIRVYVNRGKEFQSDEWEKVPPELNAQVRRRQSQFDTVTNWTGLVVRIDGKPSQIKSADPVTYDDAGNVIPLSERFNEASDDIRYMPDEQEANSPNLTTEAVRSNSQRANYRLRPSTPAAVSSLIDALRENGRKTRSAPRLDLFRN